VIFHGNACSAKGRYYYIEALERLGYRVILAEYPGYGSRLKRPSEALFKLKMDCKQHFWFRNSLMSRYFFGGSHWEQGLLLGL